MTLSTTCGCWIIETEDYNYNQYLYIIVDLDQRLIIEMRRITQKVRVNGEVVMEKFYAKLPDKVYSTDQNLFQ